VAVIRRVCDDTPRPIREVNPDIPGALCRVIDHLQAKKPADRPASAKEVADLLARLLADLNSGRALLGDVTGVPRAPTHRAGSTRRKLVRAAAALVLLFAGLGLGEATGFTHVGGTVIRLFSPDGTLVVEVDDPGVSVTVDGRDVVITGAGAREIRLKPGQYRVEASKDGKTVRQELITVHRNDRQVVRISTEVGPAAGAVSADAAWEKSVATLPAEQQVAAVTRRLRERNPRLHTSDRVEPTIRDGVVTGLKLNPRRMNDLSPVLALTRLESLEFHGRPEGDAGMLADISPLRGLALRKLIFSDTVVSDLSSLRDMPLKVLGFPRSLGIKDLAPLKGMPLEFLDCSHTAVADLSPLQGMKLRELRCDQTLVSDLAPLKGMPLKRLMVPYTRVSDLAPLKGAPIEVLWLFRTPVTDLSPLKGMRLKEVGLTEVPVTDLSPLKGMPLTHLWITFRPERDAEIVRSFTTLQFINNKPAAEFWKEQELDSK
jgi:hypothetical protein